MTPDTIFVTITLCCLSLLAGGMIAEHYWKKDVDELKQNYDRLWCVNRHALDQNTRLKRQVERLKQDDEALREELYKRTEALYKIFDLARIGEDRWQGMLPPSKSITNCSNSSPATPSTPFCAVETNPLPSESTCGDCSK